MVCGFHSVWLHHKGNIYFLTIKYFATWLVALLSWNMQSLKRMEGTRVWARLSKVDSDWQAGPITATTGWHRRRPSNGHLRTPLSHGGKWSMSYWGMMRKCSCACWGPLGLDGADEWCILRNWRHVLFWRDGYFRVVTREHVRIQAPKEVLSSYED